MDRHHIINNNTNTATLSSSSSWELDMSTMGNPLLIEDHSTRPFEFLYQFHPAHPNAPQFHDTPVLLQQEAAAIQAEHEEEEAAEEGEEGNDHEQLGALKEMMYKIAAMQPVDIDPSTIKKPKRRNVRISSDPQSIAARHRRERISERIRILQRLVPGGTKMDTASMLDEAIRYVKFLQRQVQHLQQPNPTPPPQQNQLAIIGHDYWST